VAKAKRLGGKAIVRIDAAAVGFLVAVTPPAYSRSETDTTTMEDTIETFLDADPPKIETMKLECHWDPADAGDLAVETIFFETNPDDRDVSIEIEFRTSLRKYAFTGRILKITPKQVKQKDVMAREIEIRPTSILTKSTVV
jgi:hypothetical protein